MTETEFERSVDALLQKIEAALEANAPDVDFETVAGILTLEFDDGSKIIINRQSASQELWIAAKSGGYHYRWDGSVWRDTRSGDEFMNALARFASQQAGEEIRL
jgi:CyaY protein